MAEERDYDEVVKLVINEFDLTKAYSGTSINTDEDLHIPINDRDFRISLNNMECTGIVQEVNIQLIPIPKPKYPSLVKKERIGGQVWFKDEDDRTCWHYYFLKRRDVHD